MSAANFSMCIGIVRELTSISSSAGSAALQAAAKKAPARREMGNMQTRQARNNGSGGVNI